MATTSSVRAVHGARTTLPPELQSLILKISRPCTTARSNLWTSFAALSLVSRDWIAAARRELMPHLVLRSVPGLRRTIQALQPDTTFDSSLVREISLALDDTYDGFIPLSDLSQLVQLAPRLRTLRVVGFGQQALFELDLFCSSALRDLAIEVLEYSPSDTAASPSLAQLVNLLITLPRLHTLVLHPKQLLTLEPPALSEPTSLPFPIAQLRMLSLKFVRIDIPSLLLLLHASHDTIRTLVLDDCPHLLTSQTAGEFALLEGLFHSIGPHLRTFAWETKLISNPWIYTFPHEEIWSLVRHCTQLVKLRLFGSFVIEPLEFVVPPSLRVLDVGARGLSTSTHGDRWITNHTPNTLDLFIIWTESSEFCDPSREVLRKARARGVQVRWFTLEMCKIDSLELTKGLREDMTRIV